MALKNQRGETLVETVVSMSILAILLASVGVILLFSSRATRYSLDLVRETNRETVALYEGSYDFSGAKTDVASIKVTFEVRSEGGYLRQAPTGGYLIANNVPVAVTESNRIVFRRNP